MTRRDRAALQLAYECVRGHERGTFTYLEPLRFGSRPGGIAYTIRRAYDRARFNTEPVTDLRMLEERKQYNRVLRARLALLLRALLREDEGYEYVHRCGPIGDAQECGNDEYGIFEHSGYEVRAPIRYQALWEFAPSQGMGDCNQRH